MRRIKRSAALLLLCALALGGLPSARAESGYQAYLAGGEALSLSERYAGFFSIGAAPPSELLSSEEAKARFAAQFSVLSCESALSAETVLDRSSSKRSKSETAAKLSFAKAAPLLAFAKENGLRVEARALLSPGRTPRWFFAQGFADRANAPLADRDTMLKRLEAYIRDEMAYVNETYPGVVSVWNVVSGAFSDAETDLFRQTVGDDYVETVYAFARKYAAEGQDLTCREAAPPDPERADALARLAASLHSRDVLDGMETSYTVNGDEGSLAALESALSLYAACGLSVRVNCLDAELPDGSALEMTRLASRFRAVFSLLERMKTKAGIDLRSVAFSETALSALYDAAGRFAPAFFGALQDDAIPIASDGETLNAAAKALGLDRIYLREEDIVNVYKSLDQHNPVMVQRFGADPWAMVYQDRVYLYLTGDEPMKGTDGKVRANDYSNITTLRVLSSADLVNWQDHGSVNAAGRSGAAKWASNSWAPCAAWKRIGGQDKFFLYFANSGGGIGVLTSDSPTGPFTDPLGRALVSRNTPTCAEVIWLFDPAVLVDGDGSAYLYFGGGVPEGRADDPGTARVAKLGADMISLEGDPIALSPPWLFEDSGINKFGDTYVYSYCSNFNVPAAGSPQGFLSGEIVYMTSDSPMGPFTFAGRVLQNPSAYFGVGGNNHHCMFEFKGQYYITYHAATVDRAMGWGLGYRSAFIDELNLNADGLPALSKGTYRGVDQLEAFDPFRAVNGAVAASMAGMETQLIRAEDRAAGSGDMMAVSTAPGGWIGIAGVDFSGGASGLSLEYTAPEGAFVEILLDDPRGEPAETFALAETADARAASFRLKQPLSGTHDLYFRFTKRGVSLLKWRFTAAE